MNNVYTFCTEPYFVG